MTLTEYKLDCYQRGIIITEKRAISQIMGNMTVIISMVEKHDTDGLRVEVVNELAEHCYGTDIHYTMLHSQVTAIERLMFERHAQDVNSCEHQKVTMKLGKTACVRCMIRINEMLPEIEHLNVDSIDLRLN